MRTKFIITTVHRETWAGLPYYISRPAYAEQERDLRQSDITEHTSKSLLASIDGSQLNKQKDLLAFDSRKDALSAIKKLVPGSYEIREIIII